MFIRRYIYLPLFLCEDSKLDGLRIWADWIPLDSMECEAHVKSPCGEQRRSSEETESYYYNTLLYCFTITAFTRVINISITLSKHTQNYISHIMTHERLRSPMWRGTAKVFIIN